MKLIYKWNGVFGFLCTLPAAPHREELFIVYCFLNFIRFSAPDCGNGSWMFVFFFFLCGKKVKIMFTWAQFQFRQNKYAAGVFRPDEISFCVFYSFSFSCGYVTKCHPCEPIK